MSGWRRMVPLEVQGASTEAWVRSHYNPDVGPPRFTDASVELAGARLTSIADRDAAQFFRLGQGGDNALVLNQRRTQIAQQRFAMRRGAP